MKKYSENHKVSLKKSDQRGQALVEFVLIMVITVGLLMAAKKVFSGLDKFINHYIADYTVCLMDYGELPSLGVRDADQKKHERSSQCDKDFAAFTWASGRPPVSAGGVAGGANSSASAAKGKGGAADEGGSAGGSSRSSSRQNLSRNRTSKYANGQIERAGELRAADGGSSAAKKKRVLETEEEYQAEGSDQVTQNLVGLKKNRYRAIKGKLAEQILQKERRTARVPGSVTIPVKEASEGARIGPYKKVFNPPSQKAEALEKKEEDGFQFGNIFRMLIIIAMILAIVIFFGGQIMNYNNSDD